MQFKGLGVPNKYFAKQNKQMYIRLHCLQALRTIKLPFQSSRVIFLGRSPAEEHLPGIIQAKECMKKKKPISEEQHYLCEIGLEKMPYRSSWLFKSYTEESHTHIAITAYYNVDETFLQTPTAAWGNLWDCRSALRKLVSSVYLESDLNLPFRKNGKFLFQLGYTPVVSDMKKIVQKTAALSFPPMGVSRMGYGYCNIIYGQIRQKSLIFFVYL